METIKLILEFNKQNLILRVDVVHIIQFYIVCRYRKHGIVCFVTELYNIVIPPVYNSSFFCYLSVFSLFNLHN